MKKYISIAVIFMMMTFCTAYADAKPESLWAILSAEPGDAAMITGDNFSDVTEVMIYRLPDEDIAGKIPGYIRTPDPGQYVGNDTNPNRIESSWNSAAAVKAEVVNVNNDGVQFIIPENLEYGVYEVRALSPFGETASLLINRPRITWAQGDEGVESSPGGWIRVNGRNLSGYDGRVYLTMENQATGNIIQIEPSKVFDAYSVEYQLPNELPIGKYNLYAHNGFGGEGAWSHPLEYEIVTKTKWKSAVYNVKDYGAAGDGKTNDTFAVYAALEAAEKNNGGVVYFPRGRYYLTAPLNIPRYTTIKGESNALSQIFWNDEQYDIGEVPEYYIYGTDNFAVEDLNIRGGRSNSIIGSNQGTEAIGNVFIRNCYISFCSFAKRVTTDYLQTVMGEMLKKTDFAIEIGGENVEISGCYIYAPEGSVDLKNISGAVVKNNMLDVGVKGWDCFSSPQKMIMEDNVIHHSGIGINTLSKTNGASMVYIARNESYQQPLNDREVITTDGGEALFSGRPLGIHGTTILMPEDKSNLVSDGYVNYACIIVAGKGKGQHRRVVSNTQNSVEIESPFAIEPDHTSMMVIQKDMSYMYYIDNKIGEGASFQMYGLSFETAIDGNKLNRCDGIRAHSGFIYKTIQPNYYIYIANNTIEGGYYLHWYGLAEMDNASGSAQIDLMGVSEEPVCYHLGDVVKNNNLKECAEIKIQTSQTVEISMSNIILDNNTIAKNERGIVVTGAVNNALFYRNKFDEIIKPYDFDAVASQAGRITIR